MSGASASNSLTSFPPQVNGTITACVGDEISLTCSRNNSGAAITNWMFSPPVNCSSGVSHNSQAAPPPQCGPFIFTNISTLGVASLTQVNSTAVGIASNEINGSKVECMFGITMPISVGNTSLCVIDTLPSLVNLSCMDSEVPRGLLVTWDVVTEGHTSCARSSIIYDVTLVREDDGMIIFSMNNVKNTGIEITNSSKTGQNYSVRVRTKLIHGTCVTDEATVMCRTSDDLSLTTAPTTTAPPASSDEGMTTETQNGSSGSSVSAAVVAASIVITILVAAIAIGILIIFGYMTLYYRKHGTLPSVRMFKDKNSSQLTHTSASNGDLYTDINRAPSKSKDHEAQQDYTKYNEFSDESKVPDVKTNIAPKEDDKPPPKPKRISKAESKARSETKDKEKASQPPPSNPGYEDLDDL